MYHTPAYHVNHVYHVLVYSIFVILLCVNQTKFTIETKPLKKEEMRSSLPTGPSMRIIFIVQKWSALPFSAGLLPLPGCSQKLPRQLSTQLSLAIQGGSLT